MTAGLRPILFFLLVAQSLSSAVLAEMRKRPVTAADCVSVRYLNTYQGQPAMALNPQGTIAAYLVKAPNLQTNQNDIELYVRAFPGAEGEPSRFLGSNVAFADMHWLPDGRHLALLMQSGPRVVLASVDLDTGARTVLEKAASDIEEYSMDAAGDTIVYATDSPSRPGSQYTEEEIETGYRVPNHGIGAAAQVRTSLFTDKELFVVHQLKSGSWGAPKRLELRDPLSGQLERTIVCTVRFDLSLSPNGHRLLLTLPGLDLRGNLVTSAWPQVWRTSPDVQMRLTQGTPLMILALVNLDTGRTTMPMATPYVAPGHPLWAPDGHSFLTGGMSPVGSTWEAADTKAGINFAYPFHLWRVDLVRHHIQLVLKDFPQGNQDLLAYSDRDATIRTSAYSLAELKAGGDGIWHKVSETRLPVAGSDDTSAFVTAHGYVLAGYEDTGTPPEIVLYKVGRDRIQVVERLDPQFRHLLLAPVRPFSWKTSTGVPMDGLLLLPTTYVPGHRYPLVIQTKGAPGQFLCDGGEDHPPSFAPQPLANDGFVYLMPTESPSPANYPKGYPGGIAEAVFYTDVWDSAVSDLSKAGMVDKSRVGIIGFSRTGWHVEYALAHGETRYAAATAADNIQYSYGEYWFDHSDPLYARAEDAMYGGPPFGSTFKNWLRYSVSFNLERIHTPLLMEAMGYGVRDDYPGAIPFNLIPRFEILAGLTALGKPVEMYYYPDETHEPDHPKARLASLLRNIDWYRFWLQGYERSGSGIAEQYERWQKLKQLHQSDIEKSLNGETADASGSRSARQKR